MSNIMHKINLTEEEWEKLETLSALDFSHDRIASYFGINKRLFKQVASDPDSELAIALQRGKDRQDIDERLALYNLAASGNIDAQKQLHEVKRTRAFKISKLDVFGGFESQKILENLQDYIQSGKKIDSISVEEQLYIDALLFMRDMDMQYGRRATVNFFVQHFKLKHQRASEMFDEAINLFYADRNITKKALRHKYAEKLEAMSNIVFSNAECARDFEVAGNLLVQAGKLQELDKPDVDPLPADAYRKPYVLMSLDTSDIDLLPADRNELAAQIDQLEIAESEKRHLRQDARIDPISLSDKLDKIQEDHAEH